MPLRDHDSLQSVGQVAGGRQVVVGDAPNPCKFAKHQIDRVRRDVNHHAVGFLQFNRTSAANKSVEDIAQFDLQAGPLRGGEFETALLLVDQEMTQGAFAHSDAVDLQIDDAGGVGRRTDFFDPGVIGRIEHLAQIAAGEAELIADELLVAFTLRADFRLRSGSSIKSYPVGAHRYAEIGESAPAGQVDDFVTRLKYYLNKWTETYA